MATVSNATLLVSYANLIGIFSVKNDEIVTEMDVIGVTGDVRGLLTMVPELHVGNTR